MSKRGLTETRHSTLRITGGKIKGYHEFKIKGPEGTPFHVLPENGNKDPFALRCVLPEIREIPETLLDVPLVSKSARKNYTLREVAGRQIGRVQYFLNRELKHLLDCGKISDRIKGTISGEPTTTKRTPVHQRWKQNVQHGGGAFIPCAWEIQCKEDCIDEIKGRIELAIAEMESEGLDMAIETVEQPASPTTKKMKPE